MSGLGDSIRRVTDDDKLRGVRGWLLLPPVIVVLTSLTLVFELVRPLLFRGALLTDQWLATVIISAPLIPLSVLAVHRLMSEKRSARLLLIVFFVILAILDGLGVAGNLSNGSSYGFEIAVNGLRGVGVPVAVVVYLLLSKRVKLTLVN